MPLQCQDFVRNIICIKQLSVKLPVHYLWMEQRGAKGEFLSSTGASVKGDSHRLFQWAGEGEERYLLGSYEDIAQS